MVDLRHQLQDERCNYNANIHTNFDTMHTMCEDLAALGDDLNDEDFSTMLLGSLPQSYNSYLSAVTAALSVLGAKLTLSVLMLLIIDKFNCHTIKTCQSKDMGKDIGFYAESGSKKPWKGGKGQPIQSNIWTWSMILLMTKAPTCLSSRSQLDCIGMWKMSIELIDNIELPEEVWESCNSYLLVQ